MNGTVQIDPRTGERIEIDPATGERIGADSGAGGSAQPGWLSRFGSNVWEQIKPAATVQGIDQAFYHPIDTAKAMAQAQWNVAGEGAERFNRGDYVGGAVKSLESALPLIGPVLSKAGNQMEGGDWAGGLGTTTGVGLNIAAPELVKPGLGLVRQAARPLAGVMADTMQRVPAGAAPAEALSKADVLDAAKGMGVDLPLGKAAGSDVLKKAEAVAENSLFGAQRMERVAQANQAAIDQRWGQLLNQADPNNIGTTPLETGQNLRDQGQNIFNVEKQGVHAGYSQMEPFIPQIGRVGLKDLGDFGLSKLVDPDTKEPIILPKDLRLAANEALDVRRISGKSTPELVGAGSTLPLPAMGAGGVRPDLSADLAGGPPVAGADGDTLNLKTPGGDLPGSYRVVEANDLKPSHDPRSFRPNPDYPAGVQERAYDTDRAAQARVIGQAQNYDPSFTVNTNPDAVNGPPVILADGTVLGGNSRAMSTARLYDAGRGDIYKQRLMDQAGQFGVDPAEIQKMNQPVLVRQLAETPATVDDARRIGSDLNRPFTAALTDSERAVSAGRSLTPGTLGAIGAIFDELPADATLNDLLDRRGRAMFSLMRRDGLISDQEVGRFWDMPGDRFTPDGKNFVKKALLGSVVDDVGVLDRAPDSILNRVGRTLPEMSKIMAGGRDWDISPAVQQALNEHANLNARGLTLEDYQRQPIMFGGERNPVVDTLVQRLNESGPAYKKALSQFATDAAADVPGQATLPGALRPEAWRSFNDAFGTNLTEQQYNQALDDAKNGDLNGIKIQSGGAGQVQRSVQPAGVGQISGAGGRAQASGRLGSAPAEPGELGTVSAGGGEPDSAAARRGQDGGIRAGDGGAGSGDVSAGPPAAVEVSGPDTVNWRSARQIRSYFFDKANDFVGPVRDELRGMYAEMTKRMDSAMAEAIRQAGPNVEEAWRSANAVYRQFQEDWNSAGSALKPLVSTPDTQLAGLQQKFLAQGKAGGEPNRILALADKGIDLSGLRRQALEQIADKKFSVARDGNLGGFSDDFLRALFPEAKNPGFVDRLYEFGAVKRALGENVNPSGSGKLAILAGQAGGLLPAFLANPAATLAGVGANYGLAKALTSPAVVDYLTTARPAAGTIGRAISPQAAAGWRLAPFLKTQDQDQQQEAVR